MPRFGVFSWGAHCGTAAGGQWTQARLSAAALGLRRVQAWVWISLRCFTALGEATRCKVDADGLGRAALGLTRGSVGLRGSASGTPILFVEDREGMTNPSTFPLD